MLTEQHGLVHYALYARRIRQMIPTTFAYCALVTVGTLFQADGAAFSSTELAHSAVVVSAMALTVWGQWFINDIYDKETDKHSNPNRGTTRGDISDREALFIGGLMVTIALCATGLINWYAVASLGGYVVLNTAYSIPPLRTKAGGVSSMLTLGGMGACGILLGTAVFSAVPTWIAVECGMVAFLFMTINLSYKDLKDAEHDAKSGVQNFAVRFGPERVRRLLMVVLPASYLAVAVYFGLYEALPLFALLAAYVVYLFYTWQGANGVVYRLDAVNGCFLLVLGGGHYIL
jgi:4-hydroxybenzoate polyprenyltransferase